MTVTFRVNSWRILNYPVLKEAEKAMVAVLTALVRDVILEEERKEEVKDPAMICERKDLVEVEIEKRAKGTYTGLALNDPEGKLTPEETEVQNVKHKLQLDLIGVEVESWKIRKIEPDPEMIKAIQQQKVEELSAKSRGTEADGVITRIGKYKALKIPTKWAAVLDLASEFLNQRKDGKNKL